MKTPQQSLRVGTSNVEDRKTSAISIFSRMQGECVNIRSCEENEKDMAVKNILFIFALKQPLHQILSVP